MNYIETMEYINSIPFFSPTSIVNGTEPYNLVSITELLHRLGDPQKHLRFVHVAGTNGKGSVSAFLSTILSEAGYKTGLYTSPYLVRYTERIRMGSEEIDPLDLARLATVVREAAEAMKEDGIQYPSQFEITTAIAFLYYLEKKADIVVLEVGLGGRLDATNVIPVPELAVIATISLDHTMILGDTLPAIASEKAGIIKDHGSVIVYPAENDVLEVFSRTAEEHNASLRVASLPTDVKKKDLDGQTFDLTLPGYPADFTDLHIRLLGRYQINNASLALQAALILREKGWNIDDKALREGLSLTKWPGRFELLHRDPAVIVDGSHNEEGTIVLRMSLEQYFPDKKILFVAGVLSDKEYDRMMDHVLPIAKKFYTVTPDSPRALSAEDLAEFLRSRNAEASPFDSVESAVKAALSEASDSDVICVFGSLYYVGPVRELFTDPSSSSCEDYRFVPSPENHSA